MENTELSVASTSTGSKKMRTANFSSTEKQLLLSLIAKHTDIIENKKTDAVANEDKNKAWEAIGREFNACCPESRNRPVMSLRKFYTNKKKKVRKVVAEERRETYLTGGGIPKEIKCPEKDLVLSLINPKTVYGLTNPFDSDASASVEIMIDEDHNVEDIILQSSLVDELQTEGGLADSKNNENCENQPATKRARKEQSAVSTDWGHVKGSMLGTSVSTPLRKAASSRTPFHVGRRRPATVVKALTTLPISEKYDQLLTKRLAIADMEQQKLLNNLAWQKEKQKMEKELMLLDIEIKKKC